MNLIESYRDLTPPQKRMTIVGGVIGSIVLIAYFFTSSVDNTKRSMRTEKPEINVVGPARMSGFEEFTTQMNQMRKSLDETKRELEELKKKNEEQKKLKPDNVSSFLTPIDLDAEKSADQIFNPPELDELAFVENSLDGDASVTPDEITEIEIPGVNMPPPLPRVATPVQPVQQASSLSDDQAREKQAPVPVITVKGNFVDHAKIEAEAAAREAGNEQVFIPSGSMFTGVLLNGLDAPTSNAAQSNPTPVIFRIKREAILPNFASVDVRECFALAAGYGQLSSERAILRTENLSCVRGDGQVFETKLEAYVVGGDGKVGVPGRLVSKQGQMIAQSLIAGVFSGIGSSLNRTRSPSLNLDPDNPIYERDSASSVFQSGIAGGFSSAANMIAKFYLDMAKETFPVVEVQAGEVGTIIVTRGSNLPLKGSTSLKQYSPKEVTMHSTTTANVPQQNQLTGNKVEASVFNNNSIPAGIEGADRAAAEIRQVTQSVNNFATGSGW